MTVPKRDLSQKEILSTIASIMRYGTTEPPENADEIDQNSPWAKAERFRLELELIKSQRKPESERVAEIRKLLETAMHGKEPER